MTDTTAGRALAQVKAKLGPARAYVSGSLARQHKNDIRRFVIVTSGRTGSELLVSLLRSHPQIACEGELLKKRHLWPEKLVAGRVERARREGRLAYGFKVQPQHIYDIQQFPDPSAWVKSLATDGWHVIRLRRRNRLQQAISVVRRETTQGHHRQGDEKHYVPTVIDPSVLIGTMCLITHSEHRIDDLLKDVEHLDLWYEDNLQQPGDQEAAVADICRLLDLEPQPTSTDLVRITPMATRDLVVNYDEIAAEIRRNHFADYLTD